MARLRPERELARNAARYMARTTGKPWKISDLQHAAKVARAAQQAYSRYQGVAKVLWPKTPKKKYSASSPGGTKKIYRSLGASSSKSAGFLKRGRKIKRNDRRTRIMRNGTFETLEAAGNVSATNCRYLGHSSMPRLRVIKVMCQAIIKKLAMMMDSTFNDFNQPCRGSAPGDTIVFHYTQSDEPTSPVLTETYTFVAGTTWQIISDWLYGQLTDNLSGGPGYSMIMLEYNPGGAGSYASYHSIYLKNARISFDSKSTLKIQNRSRNASGTGEDGDDADDVDNTPVHGYSYEGKGAGVQYTVPLAYYPIQPLLADPWGVISGADDGDLPKEPPLVGSLIGPNRSGKIHLDPGHIKTSVLTFKGSFSLNILWSKMAIQNDSPGTPNKYVNTRVGNFRLFAVEKMINTAEVADSIVLGFEHNLRLGATLKTFRSTITNEIFVQKYY